MKRWRQGIHIDFDFSDSQIGLTEVGESFTTGIRVVSDYSQVAGLMIAARVTRLACSNGMVVNDIVKPARIKYTEQLTLTVEGLIDKMIRDIINNDRKLADMVSVSMKDSVEWQVVKLLTKALFKKRRHVGEVLSRLKHEDSGRVSRWDFYNAVTHYASCGLRLKPEIDAWLQNKAQKVFKTPFGQLTEELVKVEIKTSA